MIPRKKADIRNWVLGYEWIAARVEWQWRVVIFHRLMFNYVCVGPIVVPAWYRLWDYLWMWSFHLKATDVANIHENLPEVIDAISLYSKWRQKIILSATYGDLIHLKIIYNVDNFCDFLFALQQGKLLLKRSSLKGKNLLFSEGSQVPLSRTQFSKIPKSKF